MKNVRFIREWNDGNSDNEHLAHWIEIQAYCNGIDVAMNRPVEANFKPNQDVSGQSMPQVIVDGIVSLDKYVSVSLDLQRERPAMVCIDLGGIYALESLRIWHGWWSPNRHYFTILELSSDKQHWETLYDYRTQPPIIETKYGKEFPL